MGTVKLFPKLAALEAKLSKYSITEERKSLLMPLITLLKTNATAGLVSNLNFICTHNSRRSQFAQVWASVWSKYFGIEAKCYSGGVEVTAFNEIAVATMEDLGFVINKEGEVNPAYYLSFSENADSIFAFSKLYNDALNPKENIIAIMVCGHADENCPLIPGTIQRLAIRYEDPKKFDDTPLEKQMYAERSMEIAAELHWVFKQAGK